MRALGCDKIGDVKKGGGTNKKLIFLEGKREC
jgi:hypothetical protein